MLLWIWIFFVYLCTYDSMHVCIFFNEIKLWACVFACWGCMQTSTLTVLSRQASVLKCYYLWWDAAGGFEQNLVWQCYSVEVMLLLSNAIWGLMTHVGWGCWDSCIDVFHWFPSTHLQNVYYVCCRCTSVPYLSKFSPALFPQRDTHAFQPCTDVWFWTSTHSFEITIS